MSSECACIVRSKVCSAPAPRSAGRRARRATRRARSRCARRSARACRAAPSSRSRGPLVNRVAGPIHVPSTPNQIPSSSFTGGDQMPPISPRVWKPERDTARLRPDVVRPRPRGDEAPRVEAIGGGELVRRRAATDGPSSANAARTTTETLNMACRCPPRGDRKLSAVVPRRPCSASNTVSRTAPDGLRRLAVLLGGHEQQAAVDRRSTRP